MDRETAQRAFEKCGSLAEAIRVGLPRWSVVDVVVQDEFTHDVIFAAGEGDGAIVLDCT